MSNERTPLLRGYLSGASEAPENDSSAKHGRVARITRLVLVTTLIALVTAFIVVLALPASGETHEPAHVAEEVCTSAGCVLASATLLRALSPRYKEIDPCEDFSSYVCEGWDASHDIRQDQSRIGTLQLMSEENQLLLKHIFESPTPAQTSLFWTASSADQEISNKLHDSYSACLNETQLQAIGSKPLLDLLSELAKIYPIKKSKSAKDSSLTDAIQYLMTIGVPGPIALGVGADDRNPDANVINLSPAYSFGLPSKPYYNRTEIIDPYKETIGTVLEALLKESKTHDLASIFSQKLVESIVSLESRLANAAPDPEDLQDITKTYNPRTLDETESYMSEISIKALIKAFAGGYKPEKIIVASPEYLQTASKILAGEERETIRAFLAWKIVQTYGTQVEDEAVKPLRRFNNRLRGQDPDVKPERWKTCISVVDSDLPWILSRSFIERAFSKEAKELGDTIIHDIKDQFSIKLKNSEWMTKDVRQLAIDKVNLIRQKIGYPTKSPDVTSAEDLQDYYRDVKVNVSTFFENRLSSTKNDIKESWAQIDKPVNKDEWGMSASTVNAYYNPPGNEIVFPAGIMQAPVFYNPSIPKYLSYGAFGAVAGHELSHAFDSTGRNYDQNGNYTDWWDKSTIDAFKKKTECFIEQYHNFTISTKNGPLNVNGRLTLGENIADAGGLTAAYQSWQSRDQENADLLLPGFDGFSKEQLFFLAYGVTWCGRSREEDAINLIYADPHSPPRFRILGTTANSREFREAFKCPVKAPTCELW